MKTPWRIRECALARWRVSLDASSCSSRHVNTVSLSCHPKSHTHLQRKSVHLKISAFLCRMCWKPSATSVTVVWQMTIARCRWSATKVHWFLVWYAFVAVLQWLLQMFCCKWRNRPFHRRMNRVKGSWSMWYVYAYTRARNNIKVWHKPPLKRGGKTLLKHTSTNQRVSEKLAKSCKKVAWNIWQICCKAVILHPLSREKRG